MREYKKTSRKDPEGRVIYTSGGVDYVRRKMPSGTFAFRSANDARKSASKPKKAKSSGKRVGSLRKVGGGYNPARGQTLGEFVMIEGDDWTKKLLEAVISAGGVENDERHKAFKSLIDGKAQSATGEQYQAFRIVFKKVPDTEDKEMRVLLYPDVKDEDTYWHFARPKMFGPLKGQVRPNNRFEWVGQHHSSEPPSRPSLGIIRNNGGVEEVTDDLISETPEKSYAESLAAPAPPASSRVRPPASSARAAPRSSSSPASRGPASSARAAPRSSSSRSARRSASGQAPVSKAASRR